MKRLKDKYNIKTTNNYETEDGEKRKSTQIVAEKITFLSSNKEKDDEVEKDSSDELEM